MFYPGVCGRPATAVGQGRTHRLGQIAVALCTDAGSLGPSARQRSKQTAQEPSASAGVARENRGGFLDMSGPGNIPPYDELNLVCVTLENPRGEEEDCHLAVQAAVLRIVDRLAQTTSGVGTTRTRSIRSHPDRSRPPRLCLHNPFGVQRVASGSAVPARYLGIRTDEALSTLAALPHGDDGRCPLYEFWTLYLLASV